MVDKTLVKFSALDFRLALIAGMVIAVLALPILENLKVLNLFLTHHIASKQILLGLWLVTFPFLTIFGLYVLSRLFSERFPMLFQIGKYGVVGILNTVLSAGIFNLLISLSNVAQGPLINLFATTAFTISVTNSFLWNKFWTFTQKEKVQMKKQYAKFFGVSGAVTMLNLLFIHMGINVIGAPGEFDVKIWANIVFFLTIPVSFLGNFFGYKRFVFYQKL